MDTNNAEIRTLEETLIYELTKAFGFHQTKTIKTIVRFVFGKATHAAAEFGVGLDHATSLGGLPAGARWALPHFVKSHSARGVENIPPTGPLVIASNHPASIDSIAITAHINRADFKVIIGDIPFFEHLPHVSAHAIYAPDHQNISGRMQVVRESIRHLRRGGCLLIFPHGGIEPDPDFMPNPDADFCHWSRSLEIFLKQVPGLQILIAITSGVIAPEMFRHPLTRFRKARPDRQRIAFLMQLARQILSGRETFGLTPRITFGETISGENHMHLLDEIEKTARRTLQYHMTWKLV